MNKFKILLIPIILSISIAANGANIAPPPTPEFKTPPQTTTKQEKKVAPQGTEEESEAPEHSQSQDITSPLSPPPAVRLKVKPPANEEEAFKRIKDYKIFKRILPPGAAPRDMEKRFFGKYIDKVKPYIEQDSGESIEEIINEDNNIPEENIEKQETQQVKSYKAYKAKKKSANSSGKIGIQSISLNKTNTVAKPVISKKLREEILKKYTTFNAKENNLPVKQKSNIHLKKYNYISYKFAVLLSIIWCMILFALIYRRRL